MLGHPGEPGQWVDRAQMHDGLVGAGDVGVAARDRTPAHQRPCARISSRTPKGLVR